MTNATYETNMRSATLKHIQAKASQYGLTPDELQDLSLHVSGNTLGAASDPGLTLLLARLIALGPMESQILANKLKRREVA